METPEQTPGSAPTPDPIPTSTPIPTTPTPGPSAAAVDPQAAFFAQFNDQNKYAGFWLRFVAVFIDGLILGVVVWILIAIFAAIGFSALSLNKASLTNMSNDPDQSAGLIMALVGAYMGIVTLMFFGGWLYYALMESSARQATLGKAAVGIIVTDMNGKRISFGHATGRYFAKIINGFTMYIGYIMAGFTAKKQGLHDMIAGTLVVKK